MLSPFESVCSYDPDLGSVSDRLQLNQHQRHYHINWNTNYDRTQIEFWEMTFCFAGTDLRFPFTFGLQ